MTKFLITSALPYVNGVKHLGNLAGSLLPADIHARFRRQTGHEVLFFCGTDELPRELERWRLAGYHVESALPLDLFPGTASLETLVLLGR